MFDEMQRLLDDAELRRLLAHYVEAGDDREAWHDRLQSLDGVGAKELVSLHGELLAFDWIEQNTGVVEVFVRGVVPRCYRATPAGRRALRWSASGAVPEEADRAAA